MHNARYRAAINAGCLLWMPPLAEQEYRDAMASLLYVQLAANKKHSAFSAPSQWQEVFVGALKQFGWAPLRAGYRARRADGHFRLAQLIGADDLPRTECQRQAGERLGSYLAALPGSDPNLQGLQRNIAGYTGLDTVDGATDGDPAVQPEVAFEELQDPPCTTRGAAPGWRRRGLPRAVVAAHFGMLLPGRRIELLSVHFTTQERLAANMFNQSFSAAEVVGDISLKTFVGELSEVRYAPFRERFASLLQPHWKKQVVEHLPFLRDTP